MYIIHRVHITQTDKSVELKFILYTVTLPGYADFRLASVRRRTVSPDARPRKTAF